MKALPDFFLNNPLLLAAVAVLIVALGIALIKRVMKAAVIISLIVVALGIALYFLRDKPGLSKATAPVEKALQQGNKAVESTSPSTFEKARKELGSGKKADSVKAKPRKRATK